MKKKVLNIKMIQPMYTRIVTTADKYTEADSVTATGVIDASKQGKIKELQRVIAIGTSVRSIKVGDLVDISFLAYAKKKFTPGTIKEDMQEHHNQIIAYEIPMITLNHVDYLMIHENDVNFVVSEFEETEVEVNLSGLELSPNMDISNFDMATFKAAQEHPLGNLILP